MFLRIIWHSTVLLCLQPVTVGVGNIRNKTQETYKLVKQLNEYIDTNKQTARQINDIITEFRF